MPGRILVVEDDASLRELLRLHLSNAGYEVVLAEDAIAAAPALLKRGRELDLAIIDVELPYLSGIELVAAMVADSTLPAIPAILLTGERHRYRAAEALGVACLAKPFRVDELLALV